MAHMRPEVSKGEGYRIETDNGTFFIPMDVAGELDIEDLAAFADYAEGEIDEVFKENGFFCRLSASGYLDCTDWTYCNDIYEARDYFISQHEVCWSCGDPLDENGDCPTHGDMMKLGAKHDLRERRLKQDAEYKEMKTNCDTCDSPGCILRGEAKRRAVVPANGGELLAFMEYPHPKDHHLAMLIAHLPHNDITPYVFWTYNYCTASCNGGVYMGTKMEAFEHFTKEAASRFRRTYGD